MQQDEIQRSPRHGEVQAVVATGVVRMTNLSLTLTLTVTEMSQTQSDADRQKLSLSDRTKRKYIGIKVPS